MAMFEKGEREMATNGQGTVIGSNVTLVGALRDSNDITIHGKIEGEVNSEKTVTIGETAQIKGPVNGTVISVAGTVDGSIDASSRLEILATGKIYGNITVADLVIHSGAQFVGKCDMMTDVPAHRPVKLAEADSKAAAKGGKSGYEVE